MPDNKYYKYSTEKLDFVEVYKNNRQKYVKNYPLFLLGIFVSMVLFSISSIIITSPTERRLLSEKEFLQKEFQELNRRVEQFESRFAVLNAKDDSLYRTILGLEVLPKSIKDAGIGGRAQNDVSLNSIAGELSDEIAQGLNQLESRMHVLNKSMDQVRCAAYTNKNKMQHMPAIMPVYNEDLKGTGAGFGMRRHPILKIRRMHEGIDFYAVTGTEVFATANGKVKKAYYSKTFGNVIILDHGFGMETFYAHLSEIKVKKRQKVNRGDIIGLVGSTGLSSGPHLHYEVHKNGREVDPINYFYADLSPKQYEQIIELANRDIETMD